jgi:putative heme iron utilization protein
MSEALTARRYLRGKSFGALATQSLRFPGHPFSSVVPFALDWSAAPVILISTLAEHTQNLSANPKLSLIAHEASSDVQAQPRVTVIGESEPTGRDHPAAKRYLRRFPDAAQLLALSDFSFRRIRIEAVLYVAGFARVHWLNGEEFSAPMGSFTDDEEEILTHMNGEHARNLRDYCRYIHGIEPAEVRMSGLDCDGFDMIADGVRLRTEFSRHVPDARSAREAFVALADQCRNK